MSDRRDERLAVLAVVADPDLAEDTASALEEAADRMHVTTVGTSQEALERLETDEFDCVVSGYELPEMDGIELLEGIRLRHGDLPFVLYTDAGSEAIASEAISAGVSDYVRRRSETLEYDVLADRVERAVETQRADFRAKANLFDQLFEQLPVSLYVKDREGRHLYMSDYDVSPDAVIGKTDLESYGDENFAREAYEDDMRVVETGEPILNREEYNENNDEWTLTSKVPWYGDDGEIKGLIGVTRFITEKKEYEREIERKNDRLEKFASVISHDLRNPLNVAIGNVDLLSQDFEDSRLDRVETALDRMEALIEDILELARHGRAAFEPEMISLEAVVRRAWANVATDDVTLEIKGDLTFCGDQPRVLELFENLLRNAYEHADPGTIRVGPLSDGEGFYVADDGPGISPADREEVFRPGFTTATDGTGFGLSIVDEIAKGHGWGIAVTDSESGGARFEISGVERC